MSGEHAEISTRLRAMGEKLRRTPTPLSDVIPLLNQAADEADRFYSGMMAWKRTAEAKDALPIASDGAETKLEKIARLESEVAHWKSNHAHLVTKNAYLTQRPDLPADRLPVYQEQAALTAEIAGALRFMLAFYAPGETALDTDARKEAEKGAREALAKFDATTAKDST